MNAMGSKPTIRIIAFCCRYCAYAAADLAGVLRIPYPTQTRIVQIPCTGRLDPLEVLHSFEQGADGVMVAGCLEGDCHFQTGNINAIKRVTYIQSILVRIGLEPERIEMFNMSSAMGHQFAAATAEMVARIAQLGPSPLRRESPLPNLHPHA